MNPASDHAVFCSAVWATTMTGIAGQNFFEPAMWDGLG